MKRPTIKDVALKVGVNPSTVSRALKDHPDISERIKQEIRKAAEELKYHPNQHAANLRKQRSNIIGLIIPEISMFFFPSVISGIEAAIMKDGFQLLVLQSSKNLWFHTAQIFRFTGVFCQIVKLETVFTAVIAEKLVTVTDQGQFLTEPERNRQWLARRRGLGRCAG